MRNIWNNDERELLPFTATCPGSGGLVCCGKFDPHSGVVSVDLALYVLSGRRGAMCCNPVCCYGI